jgi:hypothetical protein
MSMKTTSRDFWKHRLPQHSMLAPTVVLCDSFCLDIVTSTTAEAAGDHWLTAVCVCECVCVYRFAHTRTRTHTHTFTYTCICIYMP